MLMYMPYNFRRFSWVPLKLEQKSRIDLYFSYFNWTYRKWPCSFFLWIKIQFLQICKKLIKNGVVVLGQWFIFWFLILVIFRGRDRITIIELIIAIAHTLPLLCNDNAQCIITEKGKMILTFKAMLVGLVEDIGAFSKTFVHFGFV